MKPPSRAAVLAALPQAARPVVTAALVEADRVGLAVLLVGGPVRDLLLGRPVRDVDLLVASVDAQDAERLARAAAPAGARVVPHGRFGTVRLELADGTVVDFATVRRERYARPGALPSVEPGTLEEDLRRRDFTVNAIALPLSRAARESHPPLVDPDGALQDLEAGVLRVFHPRSFHDDPTRALRAARLAVRLGFRLSRGSRSALRDALRDGAFGGVSGDRLRREFEKLFDEPLHGADPARILRLLDGWHVLGALEPGLGMPRSALAPLRRLGRAVADPPWPRGRMRPWAAGLSVWLAAVDATLRQRTLRRLSVRGELAQRIAGFPKDRDRWLRALAAARGRGAVDAVLREIDEERLLALYAWAAPPLRRRMVRWAREDRTRRPPLSGADLVAVGLSGPAVGQALARVRAAWLDGAVRDRDEAIALALEVARAGTTRRSTRTRARRASASPRKPARREGSGGRKREPG